MYKYTRQDVADRLNISTRSVDRYIKAGKLRAKKEGKVVYVKGSDVDTMMWITSQTHEVIIENAKHVVVEENALSKASDTKPSDFDGIYKDLRSEIKQKDETIQELSMRVGRAEEVAKNSVSLVEFKKSQFLLEESKSHLNQSLDDLAKDKKTLKTELKYQKTNNVIMMVVVFVLLAIAGTIFFINI